MKKISGQSKKKSNTDKNKFPVNSTERFVSANQMIETRL